MSGLVRGGVPGMIAIKLWLFGDSDLSFELW